jgi:hypothetical protein
VVGTAEEAAALMAVAGFTGAAEEDFTGLVDREPVAQSEAITTAAMAGVDITEAAGLGRNRTGYLFVVLTVELRNVLVEWAALLLRQRHVLHLGRQSRGL